MITWSFLITVMANANVPPQGLKLLVFYHDQKQMGKKIVNEKNFIYPLTFEMQMVTRCSPKETLPSHLH